jgi:hypothetical protein
MGAAAAGAGVASAGTLAALRATRARPLGLGALVASARGVVCAASVGVALAPLAAALVARPRRARGAAGCAGALVEASGAAGVLAVWLASGVAAAVRRRVTRRGVVRVVSI